jgi:hypothetical protein
MAAIWRGFRIEQPSIFVPWGISEGRLQQLFVGLPLRHVSSGYFVASCVFLGGLEHELGFHFDGERLSELEFFRASYQGDLPGSFADFQHRLRATFGRPTITSAGDDGFPAYTWLLLGGEVVHSVVNRFGPEEHVRIRRGYPSLLGWFRRSS